MTEKQSKLTGIVNNAVSNFNTHEQYLIENDLSERCICSKFASYLEKEIALSVFHDYTVDVEYNRGNECIWNNPKCLDETKIVVDLIVHKRGCNDNLICIEMKKGYKGYEYSSDEARLYKLTNINFNYSSGFMILIDRSKKRNAYGLKIKSSFYNELYLVNIN